MEYYDDIDNKELTSKEALNLAIYELHSDDYLEEYEALTRYEATDLVIDKELLEFLKENYPEEYNECKNAGNLEDLIREVLDYDEFY